MQGNYNLRSRAVKRLMREAEELRNPTEEYYAQPLEDNLFEWHFTVRGPPGTEFDGGLYHGRITLPPDYPMKPPTFIMLTPNGRFQVNKKICLSISGHHPESWQPSWSIRTALLAIIGFMPTHGNGALGSLDYSPEERRKLALRSQVWECPDCGALASLLHKPLSPSEDEEEQYMSQIEDSEKEMSDVFATEVEDDYDVITQGVGNVRETLQESLSYSQGHLATSECSRVGNVTVQRIVSSQRNSGGSPEAAENTNAVAAPHHRQFGAFATVCMWTIVFLIIALLIRRLLFF